MALATGKLVNNQAATPTGYAVGDIILYTNNSENNKFDIKGLVNKITITESIYRGSIEVDLIITDAVNLLEQLKINGQERIDISLKRSDLKSDDRTGFNIVVHIAEVLNYARQKPGSATYQFKCLSQHMLLSNTKTIGRAFEGTPGRLIKNICKTDLLVSNKNLEQVSDSGHVMKGIFPKLRPFAAIKWVTKNSFDEIGSPFYFYETAKSGINFKSYGNMLDADVFNGGDNEEFIHNPFYEPRHEIGTPEYFKEAKRRVIKLSSQMNMSKYISTGEGAFASQLHNIDIYNKNYKTEIFKYNKPSKLNSHIPFHDDAFEQYGNRKINDCVTGKNYFISTNSGNLNNYSSMLNDNLLKGESYLANEDIISHDITLPGDFELEPGNTIEMIYLRPSLEGKTDQYIDRMLTGKYLITSIVHEFQAEYTMRLRIKTDSFGSDLKDIISSESDNA